MKKEYINPHPMGFTSTVAYTVHGVKTIVVSGQVGFEDGRFGDSFEEQAEMAHRNLVKELSAAGAQVADVIKINSYVVDLDSERSKTLARVKEKYFTQSDQPASTMVGVSALVMRQLLVEIELTAVKEV